MEHLRFRYTRTLTDPVARQLDRTPEDPTGYIAQHTNALLSPRPGFEGAIVGAIKALRDYAHAHEARHDSKLADDAILGDAWCDMLRGTRTLLNGELGRLDGGFLDATLCALYTEAGFEGEM